MKIIEIEASEKVLGELITLKISNGTVYVEKENGSGIIGNYANKIEVFCKDRYIPLIDIFPFLKNAEIE